MTNIYSGMDSWVYKCMDRWEVDNSYEVQVDDYAVYMMCLDDMSTTGASYVTAAIMATFVTLMAIAF